MDAACVCDFSPRAFLVLKGAFCHLFFFLDCKKWDDCIAVVTGTSKEATAQMGLFLVPYCYTVIGEIMGSRDMITNLCTPASGFTTLHIIQRNCPSIDKVLSSVTSMLGLRVREEKRSSPFILVWFDLMK